MTIQITETLEDAQRRADRAEDEVQHLLGQLDNQQQCLMVALAERDAALARAKANEEWARNADARVNYLTQRPEDRLDLDLKPEARQAIAAAVRKRHPHTTS